MPTRVATLSRWPTALCVALGFEGSIALVGADSRDLVSAEATVGVIEPVPSPESLSERGVGTLVAETGSLPPKARAALEDAGVAVLSLRFESLQEVLDAAIRIGAALGAPEAGHRWSNDTGRALAGISASSYDRRRPRVAVVVATDPLTILGYRSVLHDLVEVAGAEHVLDHADAPGPTRVLSAERLTALAPDLVIDLREDASAATPLRLPLRVERLDPTRIVPPGADLLAATSRLFTLFHPGGEGRLTVSTN